MTTYYNTYSGGTRESDDPLGYPYVEVVDEHPVAEGLVELAARTADAILADVGDDATAAQSALDAEQAREAPRKTLVAKLQAIVDQAA